MKTQNYKYFAFISYSRKDSREARWLQRRLEWFRFPVKLVPEESRPGHSRYIRPVYRDKTNLEVTKEHYWKNIKEAIDESRFLIVLCSPDSAGSEPVDKEVRHFLENSARDDALASVVSVILRGNVGSGDDSECLCPALLALKGAITNRNLPTMIPDADAGKREGLENGFIGVVSYILQVNRQSLSDHCQREARRQARRARWLAALFASLAVLAVVGGVVAWFQRNEAKRQRDHATAAEHRAINNLATAYVSSSRAALARREPLLAAQSAESAVGTAASLASRMAYWEGICALPEEHAAFAIPDVVRDNVCVLASNRIAVADDKYVYQFENGKEIGRLAHSGGVVLDLVREESGQIWGVNETGTIFTMAADFGAVKRVHEVGKKCASISVTKDGKRIAVGRQDGVAMLLAVGADESLALEREIDVGERNRGGVFVGLSGDGSRLYAALNADAGHVSAYDTADGRQVWHYAAERPGRVEVSASGRYVAWYTMDGMVIAALAQGQRILQFATGRSLFGRIAFSQDETHLAYAASDTGENGRIEELDVASGTVQCLYEAPCKLATVQYASANRLLSAGMGEGHWVDLSPARKTLQTQDLVWRVAVQSNDSLRAFACGRPNWLDPSGGGTLTQRMATRSIGIALEQWPSVRGEPALLGCTGTRTEWTEWGLPSGTLCGDVWTDGSTVIGLKDGIVAFALDGKMQVVGKLPGPVGYMKAGPDGLLLMAARDFGGVAQLARIDKSVMTVIAEIPGTMPVTAAAFSPDGSFVYVVRSSPVGRINDGVAEAVDTRTGKKMGETALRACGMVRDVLPLSEGLLLVAMASGELAVIETPSMMLRYTIPVVDAPLFRLADFPGEKDIIVAGDEKGALHIVNLAERRVIYSTRAMGVPVTALHTSSREWIVAFGNRVDCWSHVGDFAFTQQRHAKVRTRSVHDLQQEAKTAREKGDIETALRLYQTICRLQPRQIPILMEVVEMKAELHRYEAALATLAEVIPTARAQGMNESLLQQYGLKKMMLLKAWWETDGNVTALNASVREAVSFLFDNLGNGAIHLVPMSLLMKDGHFADAHAGLMALYPVLPRESATSDMTITQADVARFATICALAAGIDPAEAQKRLLESWDAAAGGDLNRGDEALKALYLGQPHGDVLTARTDWKDTEKARIRFLLGMEAKRQGQVKNATEHFEQGVACGDWQDINRHALANIRGERTDGRISNANLVLYRALGLLIDSYVAMSVKDYKQEFQVARKACDLVEQLPESDPDRKRILVRLAVSLAWSAALSGQPKAAITTTEACLPYIPVDTPGALHMNLAHLYLLSGRYDKAKAIYGKYKATTFEDGRKWNDEVSNDFKALREAGYDHSDMKKIEVFLGDKR